MKTYILVTDDGAELALKVEDMESMDWYFGNTTEAVVFYNGDYIDFEC